MFLGGLQLEWQGVVDMAREQDVNLICFHGGSLHSPHEFESQANVLYDLVNAERLDGLIIWSSNVGLYLTPERIEEFVTRYRPLRRPVAQQHRRRRDVVAHRLDRAPLGGPGQARAGRGQRAAYSGRGNRVQLPGRKHRWSCRKPARSECVRPACRR